MTIRTWWSAALLLAVACARPDRAGPTTVIFPASALGEEGRLLHAQLGRFMREHPDIRVVQWETPDAADQRHQLFVQWLNAHASEPDVLPLDVIWTPEFAAAGWILPLDRFTPDTAAFFPATLVANRWQRRLYAIPWLVDVGMLYWRTDLLPGPPATLAELSHAAATARAERGLRYGLVWQGARYEGIVTVFLEYLGGFGGRILDGGRVAVASDAGVRALTLMRDQIRRDGIVPPAVLTWHEEEARFAFQNGDAALMRNWPYAYPLMENGAVSRVAGRFAVAPMPAAPGGAPTAALGGAQLAINAQSAHPDAAWKLVEYLTRPEQMLERARALGQFPTRPALFADSALVHALPIPPDRALAIIERAVPRPVTPVYTQLSGILQIQLHRALTGQAEPRPALAAAASEMQALLERTGLAGPELDAER